MLIALASPELYKHKSQKSYETGILSEEYVFNSELRVMSCSVLGGVTCLLKPQQSASIVRTVSHFLQCVFM